MGQDLKDPQVEIGSAASQQASQARTPKVSANNTLKTDLTKSDEATKFWARLFLGISLSILLHVLTSIATLKWAEFVAQETQAPRQILVEWLEPSQVKAQRWESAENQVVRKTDLPPEALVPEREDIRRRFLSESRQTVKEETQAARSGLTQNRGGNESQSNSASQTRPANQASISNDRSGSKERDPRRRLPELDSFAGGLPVPRFSQGDFDRQNNESANSPRELLMPADPRRLSGVSTSGERLPEDVRIGNFTALNTDRFIYYTFYARIEEQIRHRWVRYVKAAIYGSGDVVPGKREFLTNLEIVLNRQGEFVRAMVHQSSGSKDLDAAPILAFREARMIPNPPRELIKPDGTIRLLYSFSVDNLPPTNKLSSAKEDRSELE